MNNEYQYQQISESDQSSSARPITIASTIHSPTKKESASDVEPKILVVYSGPSTLTEGDPDKNMLYLRNLEYFLLHGLDCATQDTIVVLGYDVAKQYRHQITQLNLACQRQHYSQSHTITLVERENECYDMESVRLVMHGNITNILDYDYFIYVNCGTTGPMMPQKETHIPWTRKFLERLVGNVKMVGLSHVCLQYETHIQSMVYALDQVSMKIILDSDCVYDCRPYKQVNQSEMDFINAISGVSTRDVLKNKTSSREGILPYSSCRRVVNHMSSSVQLSRFSFVSAFGLVRLSMAYPLSRITCPICTS